MFAKYMKSDKKQGGHDRAKTEVMAMEARHRRERADMEARHADMLAAIPPQPAPDPLLLRVAAYVADCADCNRAPSHQDALRRRYATTGAALHYALADALRLAWVGQSADGALYWRDAGSESSCPLRGWAALGEKLRG